MPSAQTLPLFGPRGRLLAVDDGNGALGDVPLRMVRMGVDVIFSAEVDEAGLLARQEGESVCGLLLPSVGGERHVDQTLEVVTPHTGVGADRVAIMGPRLDEHSIDRLRERGVRWRLWDPFEDRDLRFIGRTLVSTGSEMDLRMHMRVPTALPASIERRGQKSEVMVGDLSLSGAYVETRGRLPTGNQLHLEIDLPSAPVRVRALIRWTREGGGDTGARRGFGVEFLRPSAAAIDTIREHLESEIQRFEL